MNSITIKMSATPADSEAVLLPKSIQFSVASVITEPKDTQVTFEIEDSLKNYINDKFVVTFTWNGTGIPVTNDSSIVKTVKATDTYKLDVCLASSDDGCENGTSSSGEIVVESEV